MLSTQIQQLIIVAKSKGEVTQKMANLILARARQLGDNEDEVLKELGIASQPEPLTPQSEQPSRYSQENKFHKDNSQTVKQEEPPVEWESDEDAEEFDEDSEELDDDVIEENPAANFIKKFSGKKLMIIVGSVIGALCLLVVLLMVLPKCGSDGTSYDYDMDEDDDDNSEMVDRRTRDSSMPTDEADEAEDDAGSDMVPQDMSLSELHDEYLNSVIPIGSPLSFAVVEQWAGALSEQRLTENDLYGIDSDFLRLIRNSIYARHGYIFKSDDLQDFFGTYNWYKPKKSDVTNELSEIEKYNINFIKSHE